MFKQTQLSDFFKSTMPNKTDNSTKKKYKLPHPIIRLDSSDSENDFEDSKNKKTEAATKVRTEEKKIINKSATKEPRKRVAKNVNLENEPSPAKKPRKKSENTSNPTQSKSQVKTKKNNIPNKKITHSKDILENATNTDRVKMDSSKSKTRLEIISVETCSLPNINQKNQNMEESTIFKQKQINSSKKEPVGPKPTNKSKVSTLKLASSVSKSTSKPSSEGNKIVSYSQEASTSTAPITTPPRSTLAKVQTTSLSKNIVMMEQINSENTNVEELKSTINTVMMKLNSPKKSNETLTVTCSKEEEFRLLNQSSVHGMSQDLCVSESVCESETPTQTDSEEFLRNLDDYIVTNSNLNVSTTTEEYSDFDTTIDSARKGQAYSRSIEERCTEEVTVVINEKNPSKISRDIFGVKEARYNEQDTGRQTFINLPLAELIRSNDNSKNEPTVTVITIDKIPISKIKEKSSPIKDEKLTKPFVEITTSPKKTRYSEENHQRLIGNVEKIGEWVLENFGKFLNPDHVKLFTELMVLNNLSYQAFCLRLFTRLNRFHIYENICETLRMSDDPKERKEMLNLLVEKKFVTTDYSKEEIPTLLNYLNTTQIKQICSASKMKKTPSKKDGMISALVKSANTQMTLSPLKSSSQILRDRIKDKLGTCVMLSPNLRTILDQIHILFTLANPDLETPNDIYKLLNEIHFNKVAYPKFQVDKVEIFDNSNDFEEYIKARTFKKDFLTQMEDKEAKDKCIFMIEKAYEFFQSALNDEQKIEWDMGKPIFLRRYSPTSVYCSILSIGALNLTKIDPNYTCKWLNCLLKQKVYSTRNRGKWYAQLALVYQAHLKKIPEAVRTIINGLEDNLVDEINKYELVLRGSKIIQSKGTKGKISEELLNHLEKTLYPVNDKFPTRMFQANIVHNNEPGRKKIFIRNTSDGVEYSSVEETAISFYLEDNVYTQGIHCEGSLLTVLFYLLFWDIIYETHVPQTFISKIQRYPLDLYGTEFYKNRRAKVDSRLFEIEEIWSLEELSDFIANILRDHAAEFDVLINFDLRDSDFWISVIKCIGKKTLSAVCKRFVTNFAIYRAGLPDLFLWNPAKMKCCFVEVKSEKDRLSTKQILWLNYLQKVGAKVELCFMQDIGSRSARKCLLPANEDSD